jgi:putative ABC transport system substrate-binding protein
MRRRELIYGIGSAAAAAWAIQAGAQPIRRRRIGILMNIAATDPEGQARLAAFQQGLQEHGWRVGSNIDVAYRWAPTNTDRQKQAAELVALAPDILLAGASSTLGALQQVTSTIPIVFCQVTDPVGGGYVANLARPGGNTTGFAQAEYSLSAKWLELIKQVAPATSRVLVLRDVSLPAGMGQFGVLQSAASNFGFEVTPVGMRDVAEIERTIAAVAKQSKAALMVTVGSTATGIAKQIIELAIKHKMPAVYPFRYYVTVGGLMSYGADTLDQFRRAAGYVDRILKGERAAELPVQAPTKFELVINTTTAKAIGLTIPPTLLARADEVIE